MACLICKQSASYFYSYSCKNSHKVHKECLLSGRFDIELFKSCKSCIGKILSETKPSTYCFTCASALSSPPANCKKFRNFCKNCTAQYLERHHFQSCKPCKESYQNIVKECFSCRTLSLKKEIFYTPRCNLHPFCKNCINQVPSDLKLCSDCVVYFTILQQRDDPSRMICNLCGKFPDGNTSTCMQGHYYCKHCILLTKEMDIRIYYRVRKCPSCLKMLKMVEIDSEGGIRMVSQEEEKFEEKKIEENFTIPETEKKKPPFEEERKAEIIKRPAEKKNPPFEEEKKAEIIKKPVENLKQTIINPRKNYFSDSFSPCTECGDPQGYPFPCGDSFCFTCLFSFYSTNLNAAAMSIIYKSPESLPEKFFSICPKCKSSMQVPLLLITSKVIKSLPDDWVAVFLEFLPYFDGMKTKFSICSCGNCVGKIRNFRMNCKC